MPRARTMREILIEQGVTDETVMRQHIQFVYEMMRHMYPVRLNNQRYRVNPENPNSFPPMMG